MEAGLARREAAWPPCSRVGGAAVPRLGDVLEVVGGKETGGIKVRQGKETISPEEPCRLATGAHVRALEHEAGRLRYELLEGEGPASGWVSLRANGKDLLVGVALAGELPEGLPEGRCLKAGAEAAWRYGLRLAEARGAQAPAAAEAAGLHGARTAFPLWHASCDGGAVGVSPLPAPGEVRVALGRNPGSSAHEGRGDADGAEEEEVIMCQHCKLPVGQIAYTVGSKKSRLMHGECMAQHMLRELREEEDSRRQKEAEVKRSRRAEYDIGWRAEAIPSNAGPAQKLGCAVVPQGMCCLALDDEGSLDVTPTLEPAAAINLEYLSVALRVRRAEGREPLFSLDPADPGRSANDAEAAMQVKRFEPEWLAGTSVGEVMFQADYHLKELSMGEYEQPVLGMRSCFDYSKEEGSEDAWTAREWFVVRRAEIHMSEDSVVIPFIKMGVEAREQLLGPDGLEDAPLTRHDHPLVRYAEDFTQNFDLISERRSVIYQLREVAKASVVAKFLLESGARLEESWFNLAEEAEVSCCLEVPQLWNDRCYSQIRVLDGALVDAELRSKKAVRRHTVYGGVDFGIDRFRLAAPSRIATSVVGGRVALSAPSSTLMAASTQRLALGPQRAFTRLAGPLSAAPMSLAPSRVAASLGVPQRLAAPISGMSLAASLRAPAGALSMSAALRAPQGVDLNLDQFNLSAPVMASGEVRCNDAELVVGSAFWDSLGPGAASSGLAEEDRSLLQKVFNPHLSDRRGDGERFAPPPTGHAYVLRLGELLRAEEEVRRGRREHFLSGQFVEEDAGPLFPSSWTSTFQGKAAGAASRGGLLQARHDFRAEAAALRAALRSEKPAFDRQTEDGARFRVYRLGGLEVRTTQEHDGEELIGAVFSVRAAMQAWGGKWNQSAGDSEKIVKATEFVERALDGSGGRRSYAVLETEAGHAIVTEQLRDGMATWQEDPQDLEDRNSLAKVIRTAECRAGAVTVRDLRGFQMKETRLFGLGPATAGKCEQYAQIVFCRATGQAHGFSAGWLRPRQRDQHQPQRPPRCSQARPREPAGAKKRLDPAMRNYAVALA